MTNPEVQIIAENCDNEKNAQAGESDRLEHQPIFDTYTGIDKNINLQNTLNFGITGSILLLLFIVLLMLYMGLNKKGNKNE